MKEFYNAPEVKLITFLPVEAVALEIGPIEAVNDRFKDGAALEDSDDLSLDFDD